MNAGKPRSAGTPAGSVAEKNGSDLRVRTKCRNSQKRPVLPASTDSITYIRGDWTEFRDPSRISAKAGVRRQLLPRVVVKELTDNALDASDIVSFGILSGDAGEVRFFVEDNGAGMKGSDKDVAAGFSIRRPLASSKTIRKPTRGMLGNGLRVVAGVVLIAGGELKVSTRGRTLTLLPQMEDGSTRIVATEPWEGTGTRVEVTLRGELADIASADEGLFDWADTAAELAAPLAGESYKGKSSPWWYSTDAFWELLQAAGGVPVETVIGELESCTGRKRKADVAGELGRRACAAVTRGEASELLARARKMSRPVNANRLGKVGKRTDYFGYAIGSGEFKRDGATVPYVIEVWANRADEPGATVCVNRTPVVTAFNLQREEGTNYAIFGGGLRHCFTVGQKRCGEYELLINVTAPLVPLTTSGKEPDLTPMRVEILTACAKAIRGAKRTTPKATTNGGNQKSVILRNLEKAIAQLSGNGTCYFSLRQLFYFLRPLLIQAIEREPNYGTFSRIIGAYEDSCGDIEWLYRDDRGTLYHPHTGESISLGTRSIAGYSRPAWAFNKILYSEKEGFFPILQQARWPERHDCALLTSKGFATRAAREVLRLIKTTGEPIIFFSLHDADGPGTVIHQHLVNTLERHGIVVVNLGLDPEEGRRMALQVEPVMRESKKRMIPVGDYLPDLDKEWLQRNRIELNAMTTPQLLAFLDEKMKKHGSGKVIPPPAVIREHVQTTTRAELTRRITHEITLAANIPAQVDAILQANKAKMTAATTKAIKRLPSELSRDPAKHWTDMAKAAVSLIADRALSTSNPKGGGA